MFDWFRKKSLPVHPPWRAGQYVTYFLQRDDGSWCAFALRLLGQTEDGDWILQGDFKTDTAECSVWFRSDPSAPPNTPDPIPVREAIFRASAEGSDPMRQMSESPTAMATLAMNLLMVRRWPAATESLRGRPRQVNYPCEITQAYTLVTEAPAYEKHHDLHPSVLLTGVACLSIDGGRNPMTVTSFGLNDAEAEGPTSYDDFIDFSHPKRVTHDGFALTYPATWFLRPRTPDDEQEQEQEQETKADEYFALLGGISCSLSVSVSLQRDTAARVAEERDAVLSRMSAPLEGSMGRLSPRGALPLSGNTKAFVSDLENKAIDGMSYNAVYVSEDGERFAHVVAFLCVSKKNPRARETLATYERVAREILESFAFV